MMLRQLLVVVLAASLVAGLLAQQTPQVQPPVFRAGVDSLALVVQVVDRDGRRQHRRAVGCAAPDGAAHDRVDGTGRGHKDE